MWNMHVFMYIYTVLMQTLEVKAIFTHQYMKIFVRTNYMYMLNVKVKKKTTKKRRKITDNKVTAKCHSLFSFASTSGKQE